MDGWKESGAERPSWRRFGAALPSAARGGIAWPAPPPCRRHALLARCRRGGLGKGRGWGGTLALFPRAGALANFRRHTHAPWRGTGERASPHTRVCAASARAFGACGVVGAPVPVRGATHWPAKEERKSERRRVLRAALRPLIEPCPSSSRPRRARQQGAPTTLHLTRLSHGHTVETRAHTRGAPVPAPPHAQPPPPPHTRAAGRTASGWRRSWGRWTFW